MIKYNVKRNGIITNSWTSDFANESYYEECFGNPERWVLHKDEPLAKLYDEADILEERVVEDIPAMDAILDDNGIIIQEATPAKTHKEVKLRAEYTIEIVDITAEIEQQKTNEEALAYLASTDWMVIRQLDSGVAMPEEVRLARQAARERIVK